MTSRASASAPRAGAWIFGPAVDLLIGCGAWSLPLLAITFYLSQHAAVQMSFVFYFLGVFCNQPHYMATVYRAYRTPYDFHRYRFFTVYVTLFVVLTAVVVHLAPNLFPWLLTFYITWSPWHYSGQNFGISLMLARRAGAQPTEETRNLIWWSYLASYAVWFLALHNTGTASQPNLLVLPISQHIARLGELFFGLVYLATGGIGHGRLIRQVGFRAMAGPLTLFVTQFLWFLLPELLRVNSDLEFPPTYSSAGILAFMHCAQYLWITSYYARKEKQAGASKPEGNIPHDPGFRFAPYYAVLVLGGIALFIPGPWLASRVFGHDLVESFFIFAALVNLHHFILDGAIWKLRDGRIARLLLGRNAPTGETNDAAVESGPHRFLRWSFGYTASARILRYSLAAALIGLAVLDQSQFWLTLKTSGQPAFAFAQWLNPQDTRVYFQRAKRLVAEEKTPEAIAELRQAIVINPRNVQAQHLLGELLFKSGDTAAASAHYDQMAALFPPDYVVLVNSGLLASRNGDTAKSVERFEAALRLAPQESKLHLYLGQAWETGGNYAAAGREYASYITLHKDDYSNPEVLTDYLRAALKLADLSLRQNRPKDAADLYHRIEILARDNGRTEERELAASNLHNLDAAP